MGERIIGHRFQQGKAKVRDANFLHKKKACSLLSNVSEKLKRNKVWYIFTFFPLKEATL